MEYLPSRSLLEEREDAALVAALADADVDVEADVGAWHHQSPSAGASRFGAERSAPRRAVKAVLVALCSTALVGCIVRSWPRAASTVPESAPVGSDYVGLSSIAAPKTQESVQEMMDRLEKELKDEGTDLKKTDPQASIAPFSAPKKVPAAAPVATTAAPAAPVATTAAPVATTAAPVAATTAAPAAPAVASTAAPAAVTAAAFAEPHTAAATTSKQPVYSKEDNKWLDYEPLESRNDGNVCDMQEELFEGLCYKQCALLTNGEKPVRKSAWTCCNTDPCDNLAEVAQHVFKNPFKEASKCLHHCDGNFGGQVACGGYDVGADGSCPHAPGACLTDEELHLGVCYKKCDLLTKGEYPHRTGAASCCKENSEFGCLKAGASKLSASFQVGGGDGNHTPAEPHGPIESLTEDLSATTTTTTLAPSARGSKLIPEETMNDGNVCDDAEEMFEMLCYKKCSLLTNGVAPYRVSAWNCCENNPCDAKKIHRAKTGPFNLPCKGFDISGDGHCPHKAGACYEDEEFYYGTCYKSCKILTNDEYPNRSSPTTCCKTTGFGCIMPSNFKMSVDFDVGGGKGDRDPNTIATPHEPIQSITENTTGPSAVDLQDEKSVAKAGYTEFEVVPGKIVNVREGPSPTARVINVKKGGSIFYGKLASQGGWVNLLEGGYMMLKAGGEFLVGEVHQEP